MEQDIMVSICCLAYNQEDYIRKTLDGFLMQKCNFKFEVLVHDDASTDGTAKIIREYEEKYPEIIKPIYQSENQYSQHVRIDVEHIYPRVKGKYLAFCEGDDFWTDPYKLQKQVDALENNPSCHMCLCRVKGVWEDETPVGRTYPNFDLDTGIVNKKDLIDYICTNDYIFQTSSYFCLFEDLKECITTLPKFYEVSATGDTPLLLYFATKGDFYYICDEMSCYRQDSKSSKERRENYNNTEEKIVSWFNKQIEMMQEFDKYTNGEYHKYCQRKINGYHFDRAVRNDNYKEMLKPKYRCFRKDYSLKYKVKLVIMALFPFIFK